MHNRLNVTIVADTSIGITVIVFLAVLGYHSVGWMCTLKRRWYLLKGYADVEEDIPHSQVIEREIDSIS